MGHRLPFAGTKSVGGTIEPSEIISDAMVRMDVPIDTSTTITYFK
jgi:hypothetical protein